jgi:hypothetical protein
VYCSTTAASTASWRLALELVGHLRGLVELAPCEPRISSMRLERSTGSGQLHLGLAGLLAQLVLDGADLLDLGVGDVERVEDLGLGDLARAGLHHEDRVLGAGDDEVEVGLLEELLLRRVDDEVALHLADADGADRAWAAGRARA